MDGWVKPGRGLRGGPGARQHCPVGRTEGAAKDGDPPTVGGAAKKPRSPARSPAGEQRDPAEYPVGRVPGGLHSAGHNRPGQAPGLAGCVAARRVRAAPASLGEEAPLKGSVPSHPSRSDRSPGPAHLCNGGVPTLDVRRQADAYRGAHAQRDADAGGLRRGRAGGRGAGQKQQDAESSFRISWAGVAPQWFGWPRPAPAARPPARRPLPCLLLDLTPQAARSQTTATAF